MKAKGDIEQTYGKILRQYESGFETTREDIEGYESEL
jgi:hypothetical protein